MRALYMTWLDLAFLHWPVPAESLRALVPRELEIDTYDGNAWVGIVPFEMRNVRLYAAPPIPTARNFPELNVRTYVRYGGRAGVYFFSLDATSRLVVIGARLSTGLPYHHADMRIRRDASGIRYDSRRVRSGEAAEFAGRYRAVGDVFTSDAGSFEFWCTERYSLFSRRGGAGALLRLDIEHPRWPLQRATAHIETNTVAQASGISLPAREPHVLFVARQDVVAYWPRSVS